VIEAEGPNRVGAAIISPEDGNRSSFQKAVFFKNITRWTKSKNKILSSTILVSAYESRDRYTHVVH
jgi:hypothetical protein